MRRDSILLALAFVAVATAFVGSTVVAQRMAREVSGLAASIARDAAPGLASMSNVRSEVRRLQELVTRVAVLGTLTDERAEIDETRRNLDAHLAEFRSLPTSEDELKLLSELQTDIRSFDEAVERVIAHLGSHQPEKAAAVLSRELRPLADEATGAASKLVQLDAKAAEDAALRIEEVHRRADRMALEMDTLCVVLAAVAAWLVVRAVANARKLQEEHREMIERRAEELEQFAGRVAHDVLSPLATVGLALSVANKTGSPTQRTALQRGSASLQRVRGIVDALLEFARSGARPEPGASCEVRPIVSGLLEELRPQAEAAAVELRAEPIPECAISCSPGVLIVVLSNLLRNAVKYLGDAAERQVVFRVRARRSTVLFEVEDSGPGIPAELGDRIFEPYVRGRRASATRPGIGLGLATVKRLVTAHGGSLGTTRGSALGGALFWFELPRSLAAEPPSPPAESVMRS
jgi:K+-sensing histidine kinase KdpD